MLNIPHLADLAKRIQRSLPAVERAVTHFRAALQQADTALGELQPVLADLNDWRTNSGRRDQKQARRG